MQLAMRLVRTWCLILHHHQSHYPSDVVRLANLWNLSISGDQLKGGVSLDWDFE